MRGRLIQRFVAVLRRLDPTATAAVPGGGYDPDFRATIPVNAGTGVGTASRRERVAERIRCQVDRDDWGGDILSRAGHETTADIVLTLHRPDLETGGFLDGNGVPTIYPGDRIEAIETIDGQLVERFADPPGMYVNTVERAGHGLRAFGAPRFNLVVLKCSPMRQTGVA